MNEMQVFKYENNEVRTVEQGGAVWWVLADVCRVLGLVNPSKVASRLDADEKMTLTLGEGHSGRHGGAQKMNIISESGLYKVILRSDKPEAKKFTRWVTHEVLPSIRKTGGYGNQAAMMGRLAEQMAQAATAMVQVASTMTTVVDKLTGLVDRMSSLPITLEAELDCTRPAYYGPAQCKLESFPKELVRQVEGMLARMQEQQNLNFSMIARFCTINGHAISSPAVKTYYQKYFSED